MGHRTRPHPPDTADGFALADDLKERGFGVYCAVAGDCSHDFICEHNGSTFTVSLIDGANHRATVVDGVVSYSPELPGG